MSGLVEIALLIGMFFTGACILNLTMQDYGEDIESPLDITYAVGFLFGMLAVVLIKMM